MKELQMCWMDHSPTEETESMLGVMQLNLSNSKLSTLSVSVSSLQKDVEGCGDCRCVQLQE
jgi:hypothetical protein